MSHQLFPLTYAPKATPTARPLYSLYSRSNLAASLPLRPAERKRSGVSPIASSNTYQLLALSGGGVRGIFQARFLQRLEEALNAPLRSRFSGVAATSTGAIVGLCIAAGIPARNVFDLYQDNASKIFKKKALSPFRSGGRYSTKLLEDLLKRQFGDRRIGDIPIDVFIAASTADTYQGQIFTKADTSLRLVDVALASAAAPTFFSGAASWRRPTSLSGWWLVGQQSKPRRDPRRNRCRYCTPRNSPLVDRLWTHAERQHLWRACTIENN